MKYFMMELKTTKNYFTTFYMMLAGVALVELIFAFVGAYGWLVGFIGFLIVIPAYVFDKYVLSVKLEKEQLVLDYMYQFTQCSQQFNMKDVTLQLVYDVGRPQQAGYYKMNILVDDQVQYQITYKVDTLVGFVNEFNRRKGG